MFVEKQNSKVCWLLDILTSTKAVLLVQVPNVKNPASSNEQQTKNNKQSIY